MGNDVSVTTERLHQVENIKVGLVQINHSFSGLSFLPYSVATLQAYIEQFARDPSRYNIKLPAYKRLPIRQIVEPLADADVVGFSTYAWNARISLEVARRLKQLNASVFIVFGGPQVPDHAEQFLRKHPFIDMAIHNEGERAFLALLEQYPAVNGTLIDGASFIDSAGSYHRRPTGPRIRDLDEIPSPFLSGVFDRVIAANPNDSWIGLWETNRGCPFQCTFCDWGSAVATKVHKFGLERLKREIDWFSANKIDLVYCCDANFGILPRDIELAKYAAAKKRATGYPKGLSVQNTKNATDRAYETQKILSDAGLSKGVALSMQSLDQDTLANIKRANIDLDTYFQLQHRFAVDQIDTYSDLILGLPGESYESFVEGASRLIESGQHNRIRFNNLSILPNAEMGDAAYRKRYGMETVESKIIVLPGHLCTMEDDVDEMQDLVISTASMPAIDWRRARVFAWLTSLLHFDRLMQIPLIIAREIAGVSYRKMIESVIAADASFPLLVQIRDFFLAEAESIQRGGPEYPFSKDWLGMYWPTDEYVFIKMMAESKLDQFFSETTALLNRLIGVSTGAMPLQALNDAVTLNRALIKRPFTCHDVAVTTDYDVLGFYTAVLNGQRPRLRRVPMITHIERSKTPYNDFQAWCQEVVWRGKQKGEYFYSHYTTERELVHNSERRAYAD